MSMGFIKFKYEKDDEDEPKPKVKKAKKGWFPVKFKYSEDPEDDAPISQPEEAVAEAVEEEVPIHDPIDPTKAKKKGFVLDWEQALGFRADPFSGDTPSPVEDHIAGMKKERNKLNLFVINNSRFGTIQGEEGIGKTILMHWLKEALDEHDEKLFCVYVDGGNKDTRVLKEIVVPLMSRYEKTVKKGQLKMSLDQFVFFIQEKIGDRKLVVLVDGVKALLPKDLVLFSKLYKLISLQVVLADTKEAIRNSILGRVERIEDVDKSQFHDDLHIGVDGLSVGEVEDMLTSRIESAGGHGIAPFSPNTVRALHRKSNGNPKTLLRMCKTKAIELSVKEDDSEEEDIPQPTSKRTASKMDSSGAKASSGHETEDTKGDIDLTAGASRGDDYKIEVVNSNSDFQMVTEVDKKGKKSVRVKSK
jgi:type II secretory pathway predicted ATPase ExeA